MKHLNESDVAGALEIWTQLADAGDIKAQYSAGILYEQQGENQSHEKAIQYLELASKQGMNKAQYHLAMKYFSGYGVEQDFSKTIQLLLKAAAQDYPEAQYQLGRMASDGLGFKQDQTEAIRWYMLAAENGFGPAQHTLASHFMTGNGTVANVDKAIVWLKHASEQHHMLAQRDLGFLYTQGMGVEKNYEAAAELLNNPASQGSPVSQYLLGQIYAEGGYGLEKSIRSAKHWFSEAIKSGYPKAEGALQQIAHIPLEPLSEEPEEIVQDAVEGSIEGVVDIDDSAELAQLIDPEADTSETQFYDFYNEDLSAYRESANKQKNKTTTASIDEWEYTGDDTIELNEENLVEYNDIDGQFDEAFSQTAKSIGGRGNYKRLFGLAQSDSDYALRKDRSYNPGFQSVSESNEKSTSKAVVFRGHSQSGEQQQLGFFSRKAKQESHTEENVLVSQTQFKSATTTKPLSVKSSPESHKSLTNARPVFARSQSKQLKVEDDLNRFRNLPGNNFTLQILQSTNPEKIKQISQNRAGKQDADLYVLSGNRNNHIIYLVTYGAYPDKKQAEAAAKSLPGYIALGTPWIRKVSKVKTQLKLQGSAESLALQ